MSKNGTILVGTIGQGIMMSPDNGERWMRAGVSQGHAFRLHLSRYPFRPAPA